MAPISRRRKAAPKKEETPTKSKKAKKDEPSPIVDLYRVCVTEGTEKERQESIREGQGAVSTVVWPYLTSGEDEHWKEACHLWTLMVSPTILEECQTDDKDLWSRIWETVFWELPESCSTDVVKAVICVLANDDSNTIREPLLPHVSGVQLWHFVPDRMRELELRKSAALRRSYSSREKPERLWVVTFIDKSLALLKQASSEGKQEELSQQHWQLLHVSLELLLDLLSSIATRQHLVPYLDAIHFSVRCKMTNKKDTTQNHRLTHQLLVRIQKLIQFPIRNNKPMSKADVISMYHERATVLQKLCHAHYPEQLPEVIYAGVGLLCNGNYLKRAMGGLAENAVWDIVNRMRLVGEDEPVNREFGMAILLYHVTIPPFDELSSFPLYPTEQVLWNPSVIPPGRMMETSMVLSLPKLQTQFLSFRDYLLRNFELTRLESAYEIRSDLAHVVKRVEPVVVRREDFDQTELVQTEFRGWARMALELSDTMRVVKVDPPKLGQGHPAQVVAEITIDLVHCGQAIRQEWDSLGEFDNLFLIGVDASQMTGEPAPLIEGTERRVSDEEDSTFPERFGVIAVRGCMVLHIRDEEGNILSDPTNQGSSSSNTTKRILRVALDPAQYAMDARSKYGTKVYESLNLVVRRHGRENNFKAVLETIRGLMEGAGSIDRVIPPWLQPLLLGYGEPDSACYKSDAVRSYATKTPGVTKPDAALDFRDTFLSEQHLRASFPDSKIVVDGEEDTKMDKNNDDRKNYRVRVLDTEGDDTLQVVEATSYAFPPGIAGNPVRFTPVQVEAVRSGLNPGLTVVVGPPGTGKTDVAVQIIANLYHSFPTQRTVLITHSNAALNDLFTKVMARGDIDERYLIRLGSGERDLDIDSSHDFTKTGRVAHSLERRAALLEKVQLLSESLGISGKAERGADGSPSYTCETAKYFNMHHVQKRVKKFQAQIADASDDTAAVGSLFPFKEYFDIETDAIDALSIDQANEKLSELDDIFSELAEYRPLELLRSQRQRTDYLLMKQARIVAMTCTHAAIARSHLIELGFHYDNLVMEEAGQMMEIETFIPMLLQRGESDESASALSRLKRVCLIGDHHQLPPVVKNMSFSKFSNLDQSMFSRLVRLGVPYIQLDRQGRARADIASLYRYVCMNSVLLPMNYFQCRALTLLHSVSVM
jgi:intron-binding protein aquarius